MTFGTWCATVSGYLQRKFLHTRSRIPVVAVALGIVLAGEHLSKHELIGGAIVLTALTTILFAPNSEPSSHSK